LGKKATSVKKPVEKTINKQTHIKETMKKSSLPFPVIGIGASAGGLDALEQFFKPIPLDNGMAFIVITHLDPDHESIMPEIIQKHTVMPVYRIKNGMTVKPNTVYVIPPNKNASITNKKLSLEAQDEPHYTNLPINFFLRSLAADQGDCAIAVILSGTGTDGSLGLRDIKQQGGVIVAQEPQSATYDGMPRSAINTGLVDYIAPAEKLFKQFNKLLKTAHLSEIKSQSDLQQIFSILRAKTGHDFSGYKTTVLHRRIERQMQRLNIINLVDYVRYLRLNLHEVDHLFTDLLISVTCFFRDPDAFNDLKNIVLPKLFKKKSMDYIFRVWVPGCATGEEVYSLAIILREYMDETKRYFHVQIFGTDIDLFALDIARTGMYSETIAQEVSQERLTRFFIKVKNQYKIKKEIREMIIFGVQNLVQQPPFTKLDLISCRNLLIYLGAEAQQKLFPLFHFSLKPKGVLFLGMSESATHYIEMFTPIVKKWKLFERKEMVTYSPHAFLSHTLKRNLDVINYQPEEKSESQSDLNHRIDLFLINRFTSPCVIVNKEGKIIFFNDKIFDYLLVDAKPKDENILNIVHPNIKTALMPALYRAFNEQIDLHCQGLSVSSPTNAFIINLNITRIKNTPALNGLILITFEKVIESGSIKKKLVGADKISEKLLDIEHELKFTKENLQTTIEELETSNEEMQSTNEELQSINEELETSKEEFQAVNEELVIVNTELQSHIEQIAAVNDDMNNLFNSTDIAAFFLDNSLLIKRFTPKAQELIHLIPADIGRSFKHFATNIKKANIIDYAEEVLKTLVPKTIEVQATNERWYKVHLLPYRTITNMIDGIVITFTDITENKITEKKLSKLNNELHDELMFSENILDTVREPLIVLDSDLNIMAANRSFYNQFILKAEDTIGKFFFSVGEEQWNFPNLRKLLDQVLTENLVFEGFEIQHKFPRLGHKKLLLNARKIIRPKTGNDMILLAIEHINA